MIVSIILVLKFGTNEAYLCQQTQATLALLF